MGGASSNGKSVRTTIMNRESGKKKERKKGNKSRQMGGGREEGEGRRDRTTTSRTPNSGMKVHAWSFQEFALRKTVVAIAAAAAAAKERSAFTRRDARVTSAPIHRLTIGDVTLLRATASPAAVCVPLPCALSRGHTAVTRPSTLAAVVTTHEFVRPPGARVW